MAERHSPGTTAEDDAFVISRTFDAPRDLVWKAYTEVERLKEWWGPKGFTMLECKVDFRPGGVFHYGMRAPDGSVMWGKWTFREIVAPQRLTVVVSFSDAAGGVTRHPYAPDWPLETLSTTTFEEKDGKTTINMRWVAVNATETERKTFDGAHASMRMGCTGTFDQLADYLAKA